MSAAELAAAALALRPSHAFDLEGVEALEAYAARFPRTAPADLLDAFARSYAGTFESVTEWAFEALTDEQAATDPDDDRGWLELATPAQLWQLAGPRALADLSAGRAWTAEGSAGVHVFHAGPYVA